MKLLSVFTLFLLRSDFAFAQVCGGATDEGCQGVQPCFSTAEDPPTATCFNGCQADSDCGDSETCETMGVCGDDTGASACVFGCDLCEDDGTQFNCLCLETCPVGAIGSLARCSTTLIRQCIGNEFCIGGSCPGNGASSGVTIPVVGITICLSGYSEVNVLGKGATYMKDVKLGDKVLVSGAAGSSADEYEEIYAFGHKDEYSVATFLQIETTGDEEQPLEITGEHLVMKSSEQAGGAVAVRADSIKVGDVLIGSGGAGEKVIEISSVERPGLYSPLTKSGNVLVNGVQVSSYVAAQDKHPESFLVGDIEMASHHFMMHALIAPFRVICLGGGFAHLCEPRDAEGKSLFVGFGDSLRVWAMQHVAVLQLVILSGLFLANGTLHFTEQIFGDFAVVHLFPLACVLVLGVLFSQRKSSCKKIQ